MFLFGEGVRSQFFVASGEWTQYEFDFRKFGGTLATPPTECARHLDELPQRVVLRHRC
jgi:hypothetical protein